MKHLPSGGALRTLAAAALAAWLLAACSGEHEELQAWMDEQRHATRPSIKPIEPPGKFNPQPYEAGSGVDPFSVQKLIVALKQEDQRPNSLLAAELNRRREPLEAYPLDSMAMVGSVGKHGQQYALLRVENLLYQVRVGDYIGQHYGRITGITETEIALREIVQDVSGEWVERPASLQLQEQGR